MTGKLPKETLLLWQIRVTVIFLLLITVLSVFFSFTAWILIPIGAFILLCLFTALFYLPLYFKNYRLTVTKNAIVINSGVFLHFTHIMPYPRLIFANSFSSPLSSAFGLSGVILRAARGIIIIPEIKKELALQIINAIAGESE